MRQSQEEGALRQFTFHTGKSAGRNSSGRITVFHRGGGSKRLQRRIDLKRSTSSMGIVERIEYDPNRSSPVRWILCIVFFLFHFFAVIFFDFSPGHIVPSGASGSGSDEGSESFFDVVSRFLRRAEEGAPGAGQPANPAGSPSSSIASYSQGDIWRELEGQSEDVDVGTSSSSSYSQGDIRRELEGQSEDVDVGTSSGVHPRQGPNRNEAGPSANPGAGPAYNEEEILPNHRLRASYFRRLRQLESEGSPFFPETLWEQELLAEMRTPQQYNEILSLNNESLKVHEKKQQCLKLYQEYLAKHPSLAQNLDNTSTTHALVDYFKEHQDELQIEILEKTKKRGGVPIPPSELLHLLAEERKEGSRFVEEVLRDFKKGGENARIHLEIILNREPEE